jgi:hypothetical protein
VLMDCNLVSAFFLLLQPCLAILSRRTSNIMQLTTSTLLPSMQESFLLTPNTRHPFQTIPNETKPPP